MPEQVPSLTPRNDVGPEIGSQHPQYNTMFETFVGSLEAGNPIEGLTAYGYYKIAKREWILQHQKDTGQRPSEAEVRAYMRTLTPAVIDAIRTRAAEALAAYGESLLTEAEPRILKDALKGSFRTDVFRGVCAAVVYTLILIIFAVILRYSGVDIASIFKAVGGG